MAKQDEQARVPRELKAAGALCLAFANTGVPRRDDRRRDGKAPPSMPLRGYGELLTWTVRMGVTGAAAAAVLRRAAAERPEDAAATVVQAAGLRSAVERIFTGRVLGREPRPEDVALVSELLRLRLPVATGEGFRWGWNGDDGALDRPLWPIAQSAAELLVSGEIDQVRQCGTRGCYQLFLAGRQRRLWCDANTCGSRAKGKRYRDWKRKVDSGPMGRPATQTFEEIRRFKRQRREQDRRDQRRPILEDSRATDA